jgi:hypothetical protein
MNASLDGESTGHADDIVPIGTYEAPLPTKKDFLSWHLPRKQFVRHHQWCEQLELLLDESPPLSDGTLRYLGLPGTDLLDLRYFHKYICEKRQLQLRFLGFNSAAQPLSKGQTDLNISLDEVRRMPFVDRSSDVLGDDFVRIANSKSIAWKKALALGPFDVINLDLCDGFGLHPPAALEDTHYNAVSKLMTLQARSRNPWLLLLTTRAGRQHVHPQVLEIFVKRYLSNLVACAQFKEKSRETFAIADELTLIATAATSEGLLPVFLCGLCKWLVGIALVHQPPTTMEVKSVIGYRVDQGAEHIDLISMALRFTPTFVPPRDPLGLARSPATELRECVMAVQALSRVAAKKDVDQILERNKELKAQMIDATASLLALARYDIPAYRSWVGAR